MNPQPTRRSFLKTTAVAAAFNIVPRHVLGGPGHTAANDRPVLAGVGVGGVGHGQLQACRDAGFQVVALADVDHTYAGRTFDKFPQARRYKDWREMLDTEKGRIDALYCATPDHSHAIITLAGLRQGLHCCTVKPLTRTVEESRVVVEEAVKAGVATQVTASPNSGESGCATCEMIWDGAIGDVTEVHIWSNRPMWPQGMRRPGGEDPIPDGFDWKGWLGPAPMRPYKHRWPADALVMAQLATPGGPNSNPEHAHYGAVYHPWNFRGWWDFGTGALGDMGAHHFNTPKRALKLGHPARVSASSSRVVEETWPLASIVTFEFPERDGMPPCRVIWYDGGIRAPRSLEMDAGMPLPKEGTLYVGTKGRMLGHRIIPEAKRRSYTPPAKTLERRPGIYEDWFAGVTTGRKPSCDFTWAGPLTELILLGNIAVRTALDRPLEWNGDAGQFTNHPAANQLLEANYQNGWTLRG